MRRDIIEDIILELDSVDKYLLDKEKRYGGFYFDGKDYACIETEEKGYYTGGNGEDAFIVGRAICGESIDVQDWNGEPKSIKEVDIVLDVTKYFKGLDGEVLSVQFDTVVFWNPETKEVG